MRLTEFCTGCSACKAVCPHDAIDIDKEDFYIYFKSDRCLNCGLCEKICPQNKELKPLMPTEDVYMVRTKYHMQSQSGGVIPVFEDLIFNLGGAVAGVEYNKDLVRFEFKLAWNKQESATFRKSKYVQAFVGSIFNDIKMLLEKGTPILFVGLPCQVEGLKSFLRKDYDNLLTINLWCNSVSSPKKFREYLCNNFQTEEIKNVYFIDKGNINPRRFCVSFIGSQRTFSEVANRNDIYRGFNHHTATNECCIKCKYPKSQMTGDITVGDLWICKKDEDKNQFCYNGIVPSFVMFNNEKALTFIDALRKESSLFKKIDFSWVSAKK